MTAMKRILFVSAAIGLTFLTRAGIAGAAGASIGAGSTSGAPDTVAPKEDPSDGTRPLYETKGGVAGVGLVLGAKLGGGFSQPFSALGTSPVVEFELGYLLPPLGRSIEIFASGQYAAPKTSKDGVVDTFGADGKSRIPGPMSYELTEQEAIVTLGGLYRLPLPTPLFRPYVALGGRMYLLKTTVSGSAGTQAFGENQETATKVGFFGALGGELHFGPGAVLLEVQTGYASVNGFVLRDTNVGALNVALGYRLFI